MKKYIVIGLAVIILVGIVAGVFISKMNEGAEQLNNLVIEDVDLSDVQDGTYKGKYSAFPVLVEVEVIVSNHSITDIVILKHNNGRGEDAERIIDDVIESQSLEVDVISGATHSSKIILMAIKDALTIE